MGEYAAFVWPAYGLTAIVLIGLFIISLRSLRQRQWVFAELKESMEETKTARQQPPAANDEPGNEWPDDDGPNSNGPGNSPKASS
ncbi:MAG: heme exporter protein CcmD [Rhodospirillaceae bacterium]|nr:heme exporter protein CcmD [Rhodospirillaceae bacterium]MBT5375004.1 heme exporter protein CcmD [Rhodospirillaceae bacterium]MBT5751240.1 heme exporter protein CcmD [Rhodospirillaceae bacterium]